MRLYFYLSNFSFGHNNYSLLFINVNLMNQDCYISNTSLITDYHPDLGISCLPRHDGATKAIKHWRGIQFEDASYQRLLIRENTFYVRESRSILRNTIIEWVSANAARMRYFLIAYYVKQSWSVKQIRRDWEGLQCYGGDSRGRRAAANGVDFCSTFRPYGYQCYRAGRAGRNK